MHTLTSAVSNVTISDSNTSYMVNNGGSISSALVSGNGAVIRVENGTSYVGDIIVEAGGLLSANTNSYGAIISNVTVNDSGTVILNAQYPSSSGGATIEHLVVNSGGFVNQTYNTVSDDVILNDGAVMSMRRGTISNFTVSSGALLETIDAKGATYFVSGNVDGGTVTLNTATLLSGITVSNGGTLNVYKATLVSDVTLSGNGTVETLGGIGTTTAINTIVGSGARLNASAGAIISSTILSGGKYGNASVYVYSGATDVGTQILAGNEYVVGGQAFNVHVSADSASAYLNGSLYVSGGGVVTSTVVEAGSVTVASGSALKTTVNSNGSLYLSSGGIASNTFISGSGVISIRDGIAKNTIISQWGKAAVFGSGSALGGILSDSFMNVNDGYVSGFTITNSAQLTLASGADNRADDIIVTSDSVAYFRSDSVVSGLNVSAGAIISAFTSNVYNAHVGDGGVYTAIQTVTSNLVMSGGSIKNSYGEYTSTYRSQVSELVSSISANGGSFSSIPTGVEYKINGVSVDSGALAFAVSGGSFVSATIGRGATLVAGGTVDLHVDGDLVYTLSGNNYSYSASELEQELSRHGLPVGAPGSGTIESSTVTSGGKILIGSAGTASGTIVSIGGTEIIGSAGVAADTTVKNGGSLIVQSDGLLSGVTTLENGAQATIWGNTGGTIVLEGSTNTGLTISGLSSGGTLTTVISGFDGTSAGKSDGIEIAGLKAADVTSVTYGDTDHVTLHLTGGGEVTLNVIGVENHGFNLGSASDGSVVYEVCFLAGSMIRTPSGDIAVEDIRIGDTVSVFDWRHDAEVSRAVTWVGSKKVVVRSGLPDDEAGYPVRVLKNAISDGVPYKDLLVTPEHCLFFEDKFVPVRMLVNGRSIFYDHSLTHYTYYHIETEQHSVIWADGMLTESYLDTGNRSTFRQDGTVVRLVPNSTKTWDGDGAAVLSVERGHVEPLFNALVQRAAAQDLTVQTLAYDVTPHSDIHLVTTQGQSIRPVRQAEGRVMFMIPAGVETVQIVTRTSRPSDTIGPFVDDRRRLGVLVGEIALFDSAAQQAVTVHLEQADLSGWECVEASPCRWTSGCATLPLVASSTNALRLLSLQILASGPYLLQAPVSEKTLNVVAG